MKTKPKIFVLDTNVILHDSACIRNFDDNDIVIPITVIEELDNFKKGNDALNFHAREFVRTLDTLSGDRLFEKGVSIGEGKGTLRLILEQPIHAALKASFITNKPDHLILNTAYRLQMDNSKREVILVSKDVNLRMKAKAVGLKSQDYRTDIVKDISTLYKGWRIIENLPRSVVNMLYSVPFEIPASSLSLNEPLEPNEYLILKARGRSALARHDASKGIISHVDRINAYGIKPRNAEQAFALDALMNPAIKLVTMSGKAGTGKTLIALAAALEKNRQYRQTYLARPIVPLSNKDIGWLPGSADAKIGPYMQPMFDNLGVIRHQFQESDPKHKKIKEFLDEEKLVITPLAFIRGRSLVKTFFIVDEAQNLTPHEVKTIITRAGEGTKVVITGDIFQIDHPYLDSQSNGLSTLIDKMRGRSLYAHINLEKGERSELAELASDLL
ncbi:MAG: PhoH family protein [Fibrobacteres bacterium]|nr:PhoH family protein [Fibrobacterota bacterium]